MNRQFRGLVLGFGVLIALVSILGAKVYADTTETPGFNIITSPLPIKISATPGQVISTNLRVKNQGPVPEGIKVSLMKFGASGTDGTPDIYKLGTKDTYVSWVHFSPSEFTAQPNVWNTVNMTIDIPKTAALGYYLAVTFSNPSVDNNKGVTNLNGEVATLVLLNVNVPNEKQSIQLLSFSSDHGLYEYLPTNFIIKVHNNGNIYTAPVGNIFITKGKQKIDTLDVNDAGGSVLPDTNRVYDVPWSDGFPVFAEKLVDGKPIETADGTQESLQWDFSQASKFRFGKYTANLLLVYNNGQYDVPQQSTVTFWVLPWKLMIVGLILILLIGFGIFSFIRSIVRRTKGSAVSFSRHGKKK